MAKRQKPDPHFSRWGPDYDIDIGFGGIDSKYATASIPEGIELLKGDIVDLAKKYWRSTKKEENQVGKLPPLPTSWATGILRALRPVKGLYEAEKKFPLKVSEFITRVGGKSRRDFLLNLFGKKKTWTKDQLNHMRRIDDAKLDMGTKLEDFFAKFMKSLDDPTITAMPKMPKMPKIKPPKVEVQRLKLLERLKKLENKVKSEEKKLTSESELLKAKKDKTTFHADGGPAGGASAGGNYGGNVNPQQEYAGRTFEKTYGGNKGGGKKPPVVIDKDPNQIMEQNLVTGKMMTRADLLAQKRFKDYVDAKGYYRSSEEDEEADALYAAWEKAGGMDTHMKNALVSSDLTQPNKSS